MEDRARRAALLLVAGLWPAVALSGEGQIEISQHRAIEGGVTPGDAPGFPVTLSVSGSYRLTGDLLVRGASAASTHGIEVTASHVTLDMAGFTLRCEVPNIPAPFPCSSVGGTGDGINIVFAENVRITNGTIRDFGRHGVFATQTGTHYQIVDMRLFRNGMSGVRSLADGLITGSMIMDNGAFGIDVGAFSALVLSTVTNGNTSGGINDGNGTPSVGRSVFRDGATGITAADLVGCVRIGLAQLCP